MSGTTLVVVPFPFVDAPVAKPRPALVLSGSTFNEENGHTVLAMVTTARSTSWPSDIPITDTASPGSMPPRWSGFKLFTLDNRIVQRRIGTLGGPDSLACSRPGKSISVEQEMRPRFLDNPGHPR